MRRGRDRVVEGNGRYNSRSRQILHLQRARWVRRVSYHRYGRTICRHYNEIWHGPYLNKGGRGKPGPHCKILFRCSWVSKWLLFFRCWMGRIYGGSRGRQFFDNDEPCLALHAMGESLNLGREGEDERDRSWLWERVLQKNGSFSVSWMLNQRCHIPEKSCFRDSRKRCLESPLPALSSRALPRGR